MFDLVTAVGFVDQSLAMDLRILLKERSKMEVHNNRFDNVNVQFDQDNHTKYKGELYSLIVGLTSGEAKCVVRGINEKGWESDGFLAIALLQARYDANAAASLLQCVVEVVNPPTVKNHQGIFKGITEWEVRVDGLKMKHDDEISAPITIATWIRMLPKDYQDMCFQQATWVSADSDVKYIELRDKIMNITNQQMSMITHGY